MLEGATPPPDPRSEAPASPSVADPIPASPARTAPRQVPRGFPRKRPARAPRTRPSRSSWARRSESRGAPEPRPGTAPAPQRDRRHGRSRTSDLVEGTIFSSAARYGSRKGGRPRPPASRRPPRARGGPQPLLRKCASPGSTSSAAMRLQVVRGVRGRRRAFSSPYLKRSARRGRGPVMLIDPRGSSRGQVREAGAGTCIAPRSPRSLARRRPRLPRDVSERKRVSWPVQIRRRQAVSPSRPATAFARGAPREGELSR